MLKRMISLTVVMLLLIQFMPYPMPSVAHAEGAAAAHSVIVNVSDAEYSESGGAWSNSGLKGFNDNTTRFVSGQNPEYAMWTPELQEGYYTVWFYKVVNPTGYKQVKLEVSHADGVAEITMDNTTGESGFVDLGTYRFNNGVSGNVKMSKAGAGTIRSSAVKFEYIGDSLNGNEELDVNYQIVAVEDFGAAGDGITDDGPAIDQAIRTIAQNGGYSKLVFEPGKTYFIGEKHERWPYFIIEHVNHVVLEGNGSEILLSRSNVGFLIKDSKHITVKDLYMDYVTPTFFQGSVIAKDTVNGTIDVELEAGYPAPPLGTGSQVAGGGGLHGMIFDPVTGNRALTHMSDHFKNSSIQQISSNVFRFNFEAGNKPMVNEIKMGDIITHGFATKHYPQENIMNRQYMPSGAILVTQSSDVLFEDFTLYATLVMGFRIFDNIGDVTFKRTNILRKPGTTRMLATPSDGIHPKNNRGALIFEDCFFEASGDDTISISTKDEKIMNKVNSTTFALQTTDDVYYHYHIYKDDELMFFNRTTGEIYGNAVVTDVVRDVAGRKNTVTIDREIPGVSDQDIVPGTFVQNVSATSSGTVIRNNEFRPVMRHAMLLRIENGLIENNVVDGSGGAKVGIAAIDEGNTGSINKNVIIRNNTLNQINLWGIRVGTAHLNRKSNGMYEQNILVANNVMDLNRGNGILVEKGNGITFIDNEITMNVTGQVGYHAVRIENGTHITIDGLNIHDQRTGVNAAISLVNTPDEEIILNDIQYDIHSEMQEVIKEYTSAIELSSGDVSQLISSQSGKDTIKITGKVAHNEGKGVTVSAKIGGVTKTATVQAPVALPAEDNFELIWQRDSVALANGVFNDIVILVDDGNGGSNTAIYTGTLMIDTTPPAAPTILFSSPNASPVTFKIADGMDHEPGSGVWKSQYRTSANGGTVWSEWTDYEQDVAITKLGMTLIEARTIDNAGNDSSTASASVNIVSINSPVSIILPTPQVNKPDKDDAEVTTDPDDDEDRNQDEYLNANPYLSGYADNTFRPDTTMTRAEMAAILVRVVSKKDSRQLAAAYSDVDDAYWANEAIAKVTGMGLMHGYADGTFGPDHKLKRAEMATIIASLISGEPHLGGTGFPDTSGHWAEAAIIKVQGAGMMNGYEDGTFRPERLLTRAEAVTIINRVLGLSPASSPATVRWKDVPMTHWAFGEIEAASVAR